MNKEFLLENDSFRLSLIFNVYESDILYSTNTILSVAVTSATIKMPLGGNKYVVIPNIAINKSVISLLGNLFFILCLILSINIGA